jgi:hypothetical protein
MFFHVDDDSHATSAWFPIYAVVTCTCPRGKRCWCDMYSHMWVDLVRGSKSQVYDNYGAKSDILQVKGPRSQVCKSYSAKNTI